MLLEVRTRLQFYSAAEGLIEHWWVDFVPIPGRLVHYLSPEVSVIGDPCQVLKVHTGLDNCPYISKKVGFFVWMFLCDDEARVTKLSSHIKMSVTRLHWRPSF